MITRNNYEEFFLLYVDNELSPAERHAVERFVDAHPDLREEWETLLQCRIAPDELAVFGEKDALLRQEGAPVYGEGGIGGGIDPAIAGDLIHAGNYEEYFLSYIDGELDPAVRARVEEYARLHPALLPEFTLLQQATYTPDPAIVFPHKERLYRHERDRKIIVLPWGRIAAAAVAVGAIVLLIFRSGQGGHPAAGPAQSEGRLAAGSQGSDKKENKLVTPATSDTLYDTKEGDMRRIQDPPAATKLAVGKVKAPEEAPAGTSGAGKRTLAQADAGRTIGSMIRGVTGDRATNGSPDSPAGQHDVQHEPVKKYSDPAVSRLAVLDPATMQRPATIPTGAQLALAGDRETGVNTNSNFATQALLAANMDESDNDPASDPANEPASPKKNKLRGFFRKVSRVLEKTTSRDEDDKHNILIGGFQFALK